MKKIFLLTALAVLLGLATATAQQISVVNDGSTTLYQNLQAAIEGASDGSVIYLPGGGFPISDDVKIAKKLTIIGIGHKSTNDNVDGFTNIAGNLFFIGGSDGSAVMGCRLNGKVYIGHDGSVGAAVNNILVKCCNVNAVDSRANCENIVISQNYIRSQSNIRGPGCLVTNNILHSLAELNSSTIGYNIFRGLAGGNYQSSIHVCKNSYFYNNIFTLNNSFDHGGENNQANQNMFINYSWGDNAVNLTDCTWEDVFENWNGGAINPASNFHFKEDYRQYENQVGVYANGVDFDKQIAPVPYIVAKKIDEQTDASGHLGIKVRVKAGD